MELAQNQSLGHRQEKLQEAARDAYKAKAKAKSKGENSMGLCYGGPWISDSNIFPAKNIVVVNWDSEKFAHKYTEKADGSYVLGAGKKVEAFYRFADDATSSKKKGPKDVDQPLKDKIAAAFD